MQSSKMSLFPRSEAIATALNISILEEQPAVPQPRKDEDDAMDIDIPAEPVGTPHTDKPDQGPEDTIPTPLCEPGNAATTGSQSVKLCRYCMQCDRHFPVNFTKNSGIHCTQCCNKMRKLYGEHGERHFWVTALTVVEEREKPLQETIYHAIQDRTGQAPDVERVEDEELDEEPKQKKTKKRGKSGIKDSSTADEKAKTKNTVGYVTEDGELFGADGTGGALAGYAPVLAINAYPRERWVRLEQDESKGVRIVETLWFD
jgi:hypothetical protein